MVNVLNFGLDRADLDEAASEGSPLFAIADKRFVNSIHDNPTFYLRAEREVFEILEHLP